MTRRAALRLAIEALEAQARRLAVDARLFEDYGADYPRALRAAKERRRLAEAIKVLEDSV